jgi:uncharacterized protein (TIGR03083 family)
MPTTLAFDEHGDGLGAAWSVLRDNAARAGLDAPVPTCPGWAVRDLVAHQGMVHRWATALVRGGPGATGDVDPDALVREGLGSADPLGWLDDGARDLLAALALTPDDPERRFFLPDAPPGKAAWARRQCHETTVHAVDAMAAARGGAPRADETWLRPELAHDGVDELLLGFVPRRRVALRSAEPYLVVVRSTDTAGVWTMQVGSDPVVTTVGEPPDAPDPTHTGPADRPVVTVSGRAAELYLGLWNRGDELVVSDPAFLDAWRRTVTVGW